MNTQMNLFVAIVAAAFVAGEVRAQTFDNTGTGRGTTLAQDRNEDLAEAIEDDAERDLNRFGNQGRPIGFDGSLVLRATASTGNDETAILGFGSNLGYYDGTNGYELTLSYTYSESENDDGNTETDQDELLYNFQYTRDFTPVLYGFAKLQGSYNGDDDDNADLDDVEAERENDVFLGFGAGYRVLNTDIQQWSVQAGPGYRFSNFSNIDDAILSGDIVDGEGDEINEAAFAISSAYSQKINDTVFLTADTDIITSDSDTVLFNDLGLNVAVSDALALRTSLVTEYHTDPIGSEESTDHTFGLSLVYNFN